MNLYITKLNGMNGILQDIQHMIAELAHPLGFREMGIYHYNANIEKQEHLNSRFDGIIAGMQAGDIVVCQFHTWNGLRFESGLARHIKAYRGRLVIFIHSLEALMIAGSRFMLRETVELYNQAEALIVPSHAMKKFLLDSGIRPGMKFIVQEMWDCTTSLRSLDIPKFRREMRCTGSADAPFAKDWKYEIPLKFCTKSRPDELLIELSEGGFGLEWYHDEQSYEYMRYGNSFSLSRYLAAGIPVIVPAGISCQKLIEENHLGLVAGSVEEAAKAIEAMSEADYREYTRHVAQFAPALRNGYYTKKCLTEAVLSLFREDIGKAFVQASDTYDLGDFAFASASLKESYGGNLALSWNLKGNPDGFLIYDSGGNLIEESKNGYQHYLLIEGYGKEARFVVKAYVNTQKGKLVVAESTLISLNAETYEKSLVSLIIPAYNAEKTIVRGIDTALAQSFLDLEILVIDDGSTDHTADIADWYMKNYPNVQVVHQKNAGVQASRNVGIKRARGEYTAFMDSDDMVRPDMIERMYASAQKNQCDIVVTSGYKIEPRGYESAMQYSVRENEAMPAEDFLRIYISGSYALPAVWNKLYRTSLIKKHPFPEIRYEDEAWTPYILSYAERICYLNALAYEYDRSVQGMSLVNQWASKPKEEVFRDHKKSILFYLEHGNSKMKELLKELAKRELCLYAKVTPGVGYEKLRKQIEETE